MKRLFSCFSSLTWCVQGRPRCCQDGLSLPLSKKDSMAQVGPRRPKISSGTWNIELPSRRNAFLDVLAPCWKILGSSQHGKCMTWYRFANRTFLFQNGTKLGKLRSLGSLQSLAIASSDPYGGRPLWGTTGV